MKEVIIICLNLFSPDPLLLDFRKKGAMAQIVHIVQRINKICEKLKRSSPDSLWLFTWREYGITNFESRFLTNDIKTFLKQAMQALTKEYPQLVIVSGTIAVKKRFQSEKTVTKLKKLQVHYLENLKINKINYADTTISDAEIARIRTYLESSDQYQSIDVVRNTCYVFAKGMCIGRHDKVTAYHETKDRNTILNEAFFQPGKSKKNPAIFHIPNNDNPITIGIEICVEHDYGILKSYAKDTGSPKPFIHLVLSDSTHPLIQNIYDIW